MALDEPKIKVTKMDAALRQYRTAIRLWFQDGDPVSIHTLLAAAHEIIHRLYRLKGHSNLLFDSDRIKDEYRGDWARSIKEAPNFFKHASEEDSESEIEFNPNNNPILMIVIAAGLRRMGQKEAVEDAAMSRWMIVHEPRFFFIDRLDPIGIDVIQDIKRMKKSEYFDAFELVWKRGNASANNTLGT